MKRIINVLNGDCAEKPFHDADIAGEILIWREVYTDGTLEDYDTIGEFRLKRTSFLSSVVSAYTEEQIARSLLNMDKTILDLTENDTLRIWLDACMFDQSILCRILFLVSKIDMSKRPSIELFADDVIFTGPSVFHNLETKKIVLSNDDISCGASYWKAFATYCVPTDISCSFKFMRDALERRACEKKDASGTGLTERRILELAKDGISAVDLFKKLSDLEKYPWFGDTQLWGMTDNLAEKELLDITTNSNPHQRLSNASWEEIKKSCIRTKK